MGCATSRPLVEEAPEIVVSHSKPNRGNSSSHSQENGASNKIKSRQNSITKVTDDGVERRKETTPTAPMEDRIGGVSSSVGGPSPSPRTGLVPKSLEAEQIAAGWPAWLAQSAGEAIRGWVPKRAESFEKLDKVSISYLSFDFFSHSAHASE